MIVIGTTKDLVAQGMIQPLKDRGKYVVELDEWGEVKGDKYYKEFRKLVASPDTRKKVEVLNNGELLDVDNLYKCDVTIPHKKENVTSPKTFNVWEDCEHIDSSLSDLASSFSYVGYLKRKSDIKPTLEQKRMIFISHKHHGNSKIVLANVIGVDVATISNWIKDYESTISETN
ncbi:hypothetical protein OGA32_000100 [Salmonella enterica]|nr:hypothetical protein [Salmonella enterica]